MEAAVWVPAGILALAIVAILILLIKRPSTDSNEVLKLLSQQLETKITSIASAQENLRTNLTSFEIALKGVENKVIETAGTVKESFIKDLAETRKTLAELKTELESRRTLENELRQSSRRIEDVIVGAKSRGQAGENILEEALREFPANIIEHNFQVNGKVVEYALVLWDKKRVPIDAKWTSPELLVRLESESDAAKRKEIIASIEKTLLAKVKEAAKYIEPSVTVRFAIAAVPDAVFNVCQRARMLAFRDQVVVMPFGLTVIYLLTLYQLHLQYCHSVDMDKLGGYLAQMEKGLAKLDSQLENRVKESATMVNNAYTECKRLVSSLRENVVYLNNLSSEPLQAQVAPPDEKTDAN